MERIPFIVFGDGPRLTSGLARIARDLGVRLYAEQDQLGIRLIQVGVDYPGGWHWQPWDFFGFTETTTGFGRGALQEVLWELRDGPRPIVLVITDPSRTYDLTRPEHDEEPAAPVAHAEIWGYFPVDAENIRGAIGGPAQEAVQQVHRVLAYGRYGAGVLKQTIGHAVSYLPHGLDPGVWAPEKPWEQSDETFKAWRPATFEGLTIGAVATNQPRKDLGLLFQAVAEMARQRSPIKFWLHTDLMTKHWDVGQLAEDVGLEQGQVLVTTEALTDGELAARYCHSDVTIAPGLGEGFGYPIVESQACGTPVIHGAYAGGVELIPQERFLVRPVAWRLESCYALRRPVFHPDDVADRAILAAHWRKTDPAAAAYLHGTTVHLSWQYLWPRWRGWIQQGLKARTQVKGVIHATL